MDVEKFLIEHIVDSYYQYSEVVENKSEEEIDELFIDDDGEELSDKEFLTTYSEDVFTDEIFDSLYTTIIDLSEVGEIDINKVVAFLASKYYIFNYSTAPSVVGYLRNTSIEEITNLFKEIYEFGLDMVRSYFKSLINTEVMKNNRQAIYENNDQDKLLEFEKVNEFIKIQSINHILRDVIVDIYNHFISNGCYDIEALNNTWMFFIKDFDPVGELENYGMDFKTKQLYKRYLLGLIYGDLYEDVCNDSIIDSNNFEDKMADVIPILSVRMGMITIPAEEGIRNRLLKHFILLQTEKKKLSENRKKTYSDGRIKELKKVNPLYPLDELTF